MTIIFGEGILGKQNDDSVVLTYNLEGAKVNKRFIDIHSHIAWGIDDGIQTEDDAGQALSDAWKDGILAICSTPHIIPGKTTPDDLQKILQRQKELMEKGRKQGIYVYSGSEVLMNIDFMELLENGIYQTLNESKYLLVEFDLTNDVHYMPYILEYLDALVCRDIIPVIAHVERFFPTGLDMDMIERWSEIGCLFQVNRTSLLGNHGKVIKKNAWKLVKEHRVHMISTDAHSIEGSRIVKLSDVYSLVKKQCSEEYADELFYKIPFKVLNDDEVFL